MNRESPSNYLRGIFSPHHLKSTIIGKDVALSSREELLVDDALSVRKYRFQEIGFHSVARGLSTKEKIGLTLFVGLVCRIDDLVDSVDFPKFTRVSELEEYLESQKLTLADQTQISIGEYKDELLMHFDTDKRLLVTDYLGAALETQLKHNGEPGYYGYLEAREYRKITSSGFARTALQLAGITGDELERRSGDVMFVWQEIDDATDLLPDMRSRRMNLTVGRAADFGELPALIHAAERFPSEHQTAKGVRRLVATVGYLHHTATALRAAPKTTEAFLNDFDRSMEQSTGVYKTVLRGIRRLSRTFL